MTKRCSQCGLEKALDAFQPRSRKERHRGEFRPECRDCGNALRRERYRRAKDGPQFQAELKREVALEVLFLGAVTSAERRLTRDGLCHSHPNPGWWTADVVGPSRERHEAKRLCSECPVQTECRVAVDAIESPLPLDRRYYSGIWAGEGPGDRLARRKGEREDQRAA